MRTLKASSLFLDDNKIERIILKEHNHLVYFFTDENNNEKLFLYKNSLNNIEYFENIRILGDYDYVHENLDSEYNYKEPIKHIPSYKMLGYPLFFSTIFNNLNSLKYGVFENDLINKFMSDNKFNELSLNSFFLRKSLKTLYSYYPEIEIFDEVMNFGQEDDFNRRINFFKKNGFIILTRKNLNLIADSIYYETIVEMIDDDSCYIYGNYATINFNN